MTNKTPLHSRHVDAGARMVDFGGWDMPLHYGSQLEEHHVVRRDAGMFDVSHMTVVDIAGHAARDYLRRLLANDVAKLAAPGKGLYGCMLNESGGVVDDLITYRRAGGDYRIVVNAATREQDLAWMRSVADKFAVTLTERPELVMLALQGPRGMSNVRRRCCPRICARPRRPSARSAASRPSTTFVARTGYTGEDGWEVIHRQRPTASSCGIPGGRGRHPAPCGLGARDTLRLEAGLCLYGQDMDQETSPLVSSLAWTVAWDPADRNFVGQAGAEERQKHAASRAKLVGLILDDRGIMRHGQRVVTAAGDGVVTSGGFSPTIQRSIALARIPGDAEGICQVEIRNAKCCAAKIVRPPFVRNGKIQVRFTGRRS